MSGMSREVSSTYFALSFLPIRTSLQSRRPPTFQHAQTAKKQAGNRLSLRIIGAFFRKSTPGRP